MDYLQSILYNIDRIYTSKVIFCLFYFSKLADIHQFKKRQTEKKCVCVCVWAGGQGGVNLTLYSYLKKRQFNINVTLCSR